MMFQNKTIILVSALIALSSCGNKKSNETTSSSNKNVITTTSENVLASCNKAANSDLSMNLNTIYTNNGVDPQWIKIKFNFLSSKVTTSGNVIRFFKWKVSNNQSFLDQSPIQAYGYVLDNPNQVAHSVTTITANTINTKTGFFLNINDMNYEYQVLKAVVYSSTGQIVAQIDSLIPEFSGDYNNYKTDTYGAARSQTLLNLHPASSVNMSGWSSQQIRDYYQPNCF